MLRFYSADQSEKISSVRICTLSLYNFVGNWDADGSTAINNWWSLLY